MQITQINWEKKGVMLMEKKSLALRNLSEILNLNSCYYLFCFAFVAAELRISARYRYWHCHAGPDFDLAK